MDVYPLTEARTRLGELVNEARRGHRPVTISEHGKPVAVIIGVEDLADLEDSLAVARHEADKAADRVTGVSDAGLDAALDRYEADGPATPLNTAIHGTRKFQQMQLKKYPLFSVGCHNH